jgi:hypothetical protein
MPCHSCGSIIQRKFNGETCVHLPGLRNIDKPAVFAFTELFVCLDCGATEFTMPKTELHLLVEGDLATAASSGNSSPQ